MLVDKLNIVNYRQVSLSKKQEWRNQNHKPCLKYNVQSYNLLFILTQIKFNLTIAIFRIYGVLFVCL